MKHFYTTENEGIDQLRGCGWSGSSLSAYVWRVLLNVNVHVMLYSLPSDVVALLLWCPWWCWDVSAVAGSLLYFNVWKSQLLLGLYIVRWYTVQIYITVYNLRQFKRSCEICSSDPWWGRSPNFALFGDTWQKTFTDPSLPLWVVRLMVFMSAEMVVCLCFNWLEQIWKIVSSQFISLMVMASLGVIFVRLKCPWGMHFVPFQVIGKADEKYCKWVILLNA